MTDISTSSSSENIAPFSLTPAAASRISVLLEAEEKPHFRVRVDGGGCSGFQYKFDFDTEKKPEDMELRQHGVSVLVDDLSLGFWVMPSWIMLKSW